MSGPVVGLVMSVTPYHFARWAAAAKSFPGNCCLLEMTNRDEFNVLECLDRSAAAFRRETLFPDRHRAEVRPSVLRQALFHRLEELQPRVVVLNGYSSNYSLAALEWSSHSGVPVVICSESNEFDEPRRLLKELIKRRIIRLCSSGLAGGSPQAIYLTKLGLPPEAVFVGYDVVDNEHFAKGADIARQQATDVRAKLNLPSHYFLACSRFTAKKNLSTLIRAYARYRKSSVGSEKDLVIVGDGPLRTKLKNVVSRFELEESVHFVGAKPYSQLPAYFGLADVFVHASAIEQWGLVVNEAMASGVPVIVSRACGCVSDLICEGENGVTFDPADVEGLTKVLIQFSALAESRLIEMGEAGRSIIRNWGPERFASGLKSAVEYAIKARPPRSAGLDQFLLKALAFR